MASRREFLQVGLAATAMGGVAQVQAAPAEYGSAQTLPLYKVIYDERYRDSVAFAKRLATRLPGSAEQLLYAMQGGDITPLWYQELDAVWKRNPVALAGITAHGPLFCLERLAWDVGMKVVWRSEHRPMADGMMQHSLKGPEHIVAQAVSGPHSLVRNQARWCEQVADLVLECRSGFTALDSHQLMVPTTESAQQDNGVDAFADPLIAWVIAPARSQVAS